jgi:hypothetical protein
LRDERARQRREDRRGRRKGEAEAGERRAECAEEVRRAQHSDRRPSGVCAGRSTDVPLGDVHATPPHSAGAVVGVVVDGWWE